MRYYLRNNIVSDDILLKSANIKDACLLNSERGQLFSTLHCLLCMFFFKILLPFIRCWVLFISKIYQMENGLCYYVNNEHT